MTGSKNLMPMIHQARRTFRNRTQGNPFATDATIATEIESLADAYLHTRNDRIANLLKVEIDRLESLI